ncbi:MAG: hydrolase [Nitrospirota bacterium]
MDKFIIHRDNSVLIIVDVQERLAVVMEEGEKVVANTIHLVEAAKLLNIPVVLTEQYPKGLGPTVNEIRDALQPYNPIEKITFNCCGEPVFLKRIRDISRKKIILTGMETHVCVLQTCLGLLKEGYDVHVLRDAVCSRYKDNFNSGIDLMRDAGAVITCTETVLFQLLEKAGTEGFRTISKRIK